MTQQPRQVLSSDTARRPGECECGCGGRTPLAKRTNITRNHIKGQPIRFIPTHQVGTRPVYDPSEPFLIEGEPCKYIPLTLGYKAIVDADVYEDYWNYKWFAAVKKNGGVYACRNGKVTDGVKSPNVYLHAAIMNTPKGMLCDHRFHNTLDNRRSQLRNVTKAQNMMNMPIRQGRSKSGYRGVTQDNKGYGYFSRIRHNGAPYFIGRSKDPLHLARLYDQVVLLLRGDFAILNFPELLNKEIHVQRA